ncbi:MAG: hypothetical protein WAN03_17095 [Candidatus Sulfotelmatobacter sp.]
MKYSPMLLIHIVSGTLGMLSGFVAVFLRKGSREHGIAGNVFVVTMLTLGATGAYMAALKSQPGNVLGGLLTFYLVATAWLTARRSDGKPGLVDWGALLAILAVAVAEITFGIQAASSPTGMKFDLPPYPYLIFGLVAALATAGDIRMLMRGGVSGTQRIARHLWRMCFALFIAAGSIFLARQHIFPDFLRRTGALVFLSFLPLLLMIFWFIRVRFAHAYKRRWMARAHA